MYYLKEVTSGLKNGNAPVICNRLPMHCKCRGLRGLKYLDFAFACPSSVVAVRAFNFLPNIAEEVETEQLWWCWGYLLGFYQNFPPRCRAYTRTLFVKHYAPNHMPDPKGGWSLKENTLGLHYGICSKVNQFIYTLVCNYMQNIRILAKSGSSDIFS